VSDTYDVVVVGAGPNGLSAAIVAARCGLSTLIIEANGTVGGGARSGALTLPGFVHDTCSAVHPMAVASPFWRTLPLADHGLEWITPPGACAHPLDDGSACLISNSLDETAARLGPDAAAWRASIGAIARMWPKIEADVLGPIGLPRAPMSYAAFGMRALLPASLFARLRFSTPAAQALFAGVAAHSILPLERAGSAAFGLVLSAVAHVHGWPIPRGGSGAITRALASYFRSLGGTIVTGQPVGTIAELPNSRIMMFDTAPQAVARIAGERLSGPARRALERFRPGPGVWKVDWALSGPIPWSAAECGQASTVHVGGTVQEIALAERQVARGMCAERPFVLATQPSLFDSSRAPAGAHTAWGYCHVPNGSSFDMTARIEAQVERFAPGFGERILARAVQGPHALEAGNANLIGGDITGGANTLMQLLLRPSWRMYRTGARGVYLCSASTPPGGGVHGMCGYHAAVRAIREAFGPTRVREEV